MRSEATMQTKEPKATTREEEALAALGVLGLPGALGLLGLFEGDIGAVGGGGTTNGSTVGTSLEEIGVAGE